MPIERRSARVQTTTLVISVAGLAAAVLLGFLVIRSASGGGSTRTVDVRADTFAAGDAKRRAAAIAEAGPLLFSDVSGRGQRRPVFVAHLGYDPAIGWFAFDARPPGAPADCFLEWDRASRRFRGVDRCTDETFAADGTGLRQYRITVDREGQLTVDFRKDASGRDYQPASPGGS